MDTTTPFTEARALNAIGLLTHPPTQPMRPHQVFLALLGAAVVGMHHEHASTRVTSQVMMGILEELLAVIDFSEIELADIFGFVARQTGRRMDLIFVIRLDRRAPFHVAMVERIALSVRELKALSALDPKSLDRDESEERTISLAELKMTTRMLAEMVARADLGDGRDETLRLIEAARATVDELDDIHLMLTGIIVQQKRFAAAHPAPAS